jgi:hypothetical protein
MDGGDFQELAAKHGVLVEVTATEPCGSQGSCSCEESGVGFPTTCFRNGPAIEATPSPATASESGADGILAREIATDVFDGMKYDFGTDPMVRFALRDLLESAALAGIVAYRKATPSPATTDAEVEAMADELEGFSAARELRVRAATLLRKLLAERRR